MHVHPSHFSPLIIQNHGRRRGKMIYIFSAVRDEIKTSLFGRGSTRRRVYHEDGWTVETRRGCIESQPRLRNYHNPRRWPRWLQLERFYKKVRPSVRPSVRRSLLGNVGFWLGSGEPVTSDGGQKGFVE